MEELPKRIVLLGKTGAGKSSLVNTIVGEDVFKISHAPVSETSPTQAVTRRVNGKNLTLIDTHSLFDTSGCERSLRAEIVRCITECAPGPHAFLIVLKVEKFTQQEKDVVRKICQYFSDEALKYAAVVFTNGDQLEGARIEEFVSLNKELKDLVEKCGGRCHVFDNKYWKIDRDDYGSNRRHVEELLCTIEKISEANGGQCYTNEMLEEVNKEIQKQEEDMRQTPGTVSDQEIRNAAKNNLSEKLMVRFMGAAAGAVLAAFLGLVEMIPAKTANLPGAAAQASAPKIGADFVSAAANRVFAGAMMGYNAAEGAESVSGALQSARNVVWNDFKLRSGFGGAEEESSKDHVNK